MDPSPLALGEIFPRQRIRLNVASADKESLFEEMIDLLASTASSPFPRQEALASLMERESMMTTGIGKGIAIPHGKVDGIDRIYGAIGISSAGIDYDAIDGVPVRVAFMILSPRNHPEEHLRILKRLASILDVPGLVDQVVAASDIDHLHSILDGLDVQPEVS
ncbi:MAG TPA: PTS sugar transporter subunit IIA [bacterium]|nr:PTS sugar transporter subunit IIA [bacterium]